MKKLTTASILLALAGTAYAQMPSPEEIMKRTDKNMDGVISKEEADATPLKDFFELFDANGDGKITKEELNTAMANGPDGGGPPPAARPPAAAPAAPVAPATPATPAK